MVSYVRDITGKCMNKSVSWLYRRVNGGKVVAVVMGWPKERDGRTDRPKD